MSFRVPSKTYTKIVAVVACVGKALLCSALPHHELRCSYRWVS